jgi:hypothetical protein
MAFDPAVTVASVQAEYRGSVRFVWPGSRIEL